MTVMLENICVGAAHVSSQHKLALAMRSDGIVNPAIDAFASLGSDGNSPQNVERDLHRWLQNLHGVDLKPRALELEVQLRSGEGTSMVQYPIVAPHDVLKAAYKKGSVVWQTVWLGQKGNADVLDFWDNFLQQPYGHRHPIAKCTGRAERIIPLVFHSDGAESFRNVEAIIWSMSSVFGLGSVLDTRVPLIVLLFSLIPTPELLGKAHHAITKFFSWSLGLCEAGVDEHGNDLAEGWGASFAYWTGDRKSRLESHRLWRYWKRTEMCELCLATRPTKSSPTDLHFGNLSADAPFWQTELSHKSYLVMNADRLSPWVQVQGWSLLQNVEDLMHTWHEGIGRDLIASVFVTLLEDGCFGALHQDGLNELSRQLRAFCQANDLKCPSPPFTLASIGRTSSRDFPVLGSAYKSAHVKVYTSFAAELAYQNCDGTRMSKVRSVCTWAAAEYLFILDQEDLIMDQGMVHKAIRAAQLFLDSYQWLAAHAVDQGACLWKLRPKHHYYGHMCRTMARDRINPRKMSCFLAEDFVGKIAKLTRATNRRTAGLRVLQRFLLYLSQRWQRRAESGALSMPV